jgi:hypothetical protein
LVVEQPDAGTLARAFAHPSLSLVRELVVQIGDFSSVVATANLPHPLPPTLRVLELRGSSPFNNVWSDYRGALLGLGRVGPVLDGALPNLQRLCLHGVVDLDDISHPALAELELGCRDARRTAPTTRDGEPRSFADRLRELDRKGLPSLARLALHVDGGLELVVGVVVETELLDGLHTLALSGSLTQDAAERLLRSDAHLEVLDLRGVRLWSGANARAFLVLANTVLSSEPEAPKERKKVGEWLVRHTRKKEWGIGRVVAETDDGLEVEFEHGGTKMVKNVELLEEVDA